MRRESGSSFTPYPSSVAPIQALTVGFECWVVLLLTALYGFSPFWPRTSTLRCRSHAPLDTEAHRCSGYGLHPVLLFRARVLVVPETRRQAYRLCARLAGLQPTRVGFPSARPAVPNRLVFSLVSGGSRIRLAGRGRGGGYSLWQRRWPFSGINLVYWTCVACLNQCRHRLVLAGQGVDGGEITTCRNFLGRRGVGLGSVGRVVACGTGEGEHITGRFRGAYRGVFIVLGPRLVGAGFRSSGLVPTWQVGDGSLARSSRALLL